MNKLEEENEKLREENKRLQEIVDCDWQRKYEMDDEPIDYGYADNCAQNMATLFMATEI
mgnify:FL=1